MNGLSLHYYTVGDWNHKGSATSFNNEDYYWTLGKCLEIESTIQKHITIMYRIKDFTTSEIGTQLRYAPGERPYNGRSGKESVFNLSKDAPIFKVSHRIGIKNVLGGDFNYQHTELSAEKRVWLSSFGHVDVQFKAGKIWDKVPFPLLILPNTNQSITIQPDAFHLMNALEFVTDQYVTFNATYYLKGWILNRVPLIKWLRLREVMSFNGIYGNLTKKNNPSYTSGLYLFPDGTQPLGNTPYMLHAIIGKLFKCIGSFIWEQSLN